MQEPDYPRRCGTWSLVTERDGVRIAVPLRCRGWDCPRCGPQQQLRLRLLITEAQPTKFLTLTCATRGQRDRPAAFAALRAAWPKLVKRLRRYHAGEPVEFLWVLEGTRHGWPHYHVVLRMPYTPQHLISSWWRELAGSPVVDIRAVEHAQGGAWELTKYLTKQLHAPPGFRRWSASSGFLRQPFRPHPDPDQEPRSWQLVETSTAVLRAAWTFDGDAVLELDTGEIIGVPLYLSDTSPLVLARGALRAREPPATSQNATAYALIARARLLVK